MDYDQTFDEKKKMDALEIVLQVSQLSTMPG
jgi:hypothetical protein